LGIRTLKTWLCTFIEAECKAGKDGKFLTVIITAAKTLAVGMFSKSQNSLPTTRLFRKAI
jgi:hypothetical protein